MKPLDAAFVSRMVILVFLEVKDYVKSDSPQLGMTKIPSVFAEDLFFFNGILETVSHVE